MIWLRGKHGREVCYADIAAGNEYIARAEFGTIARAVDECITEVSGLDTVGPEVVKQENNPAAVSSGSQRAVRAGPRAGWSTRRF